MTLDLPVLQLPFGSCKRRLRFSRNTRFRNRALKIAFVPRARYFLEEFLSLNGITDIGVLARLKGRSPRPLLVTALMTSLFTLTFS